MWTDTNLLPPLGYCTNLLLPSRKPTLACLICAAKPWLICEKYANLIASQAGKCLSMYSRLIQKLPIQTHITTLICIPSDYTYALDVADIWTDTPVD